MMRQGQTPADVADEDLVTQLEDLRKQQATVSWPDTDTVFK